MFRKSIAVALLALVLLVGLVAPLGLVQAQQTPPPTSSQIEVILPGDAKFADLESKLEAAAKISGSAWLDEFKKHQTLGEVRSSNGLQGTLFVDAVTAINVLTGQAPFAVYGTITIPSGFKLGQKDFAGNYGIVIIKGSLIIALIDLKTGSTGAFVVVPGDGQAILLSPLLFPFFSPLGVFQVLFSLLTGATPTAPPPGQPQPPQTSAPACPQDLPHKSDLNVPLAAPATIVTVKDSSGTALFEVSAAPPGILIVQSFGTSLQFTYTISGQLHIGLIIGPAMEELSLSKDVPFALWVTNGAKTACVQATPKLVNGVLTIAGTLSTN